MFIAWILDQQDRDDSTGDCARLLWADINNGCATTMLQTPVEWKNHFERHHRKIVNKTDALLLNAYTAYLNSFSLDK